MYFQIKNTLKNNHLNTKPALNWWEGAQFSLVKNPSN